MIALSGDVMGNDKGENKGNNKGENLSDEEAFVAAMADVTPVGKGRQQQAENSSPPTPGQKQRRADAENQKKDLADPNFLTLSEVPIVEPLAVLEWKKDGVQNAVFSKLKKDGYGIEASLDLHRKTVKEARELVYKFLLLARAKGQRCVLISPGKGEHSKTPGRLKSYVAAWLSEHSQVIAYSSALPYHGGVGSVYVLVRKSEASRELNREVHGQQSDLVSRNDKY